MSKFCTKRVVIDAEQFLGEIPTILKDENDEIVEKLRLRMDGNDDMYTSMVIETLEGDMSASLGDWIIKGVEGEFYAPCKPDIFEKTYEPVEEQQ